MTAYDAEKCLFPSPTARIREILMCFAQSFCRVRNKEDNKPPLTDSSKKSLSGAGVIFYPVVPPCFVSPHTYGIPAYSRQLTPALRHGILAFAFPMPSAVHLRISVLSGSHLPGLSESALFALSPPQRFVYLCCFSYSGTERAVCQSFHLTVPGVWR